MPRISKKTKDNHTLWLDRIGRAKKVRSNWKDIFRVDLAKQFYDGQQNVHSFSVDEWITINKIYSSLKATLPALYAADPYFYVKLKRSFKPNPMDVVLFEKKGRIRQSYLNYLKEELRLKEKVRLSILDGHFAYGIAKVHYFTDLKENPDAGKAMLGEAGDMLIDEDTGEPLLEPETIPINERYRLTRVHPDDFIWDEDAGPLQDSWKWLAQRIITTLREARKDPRYNKRALKFLEGKGMSKDDEDQDREERKKGGDVKGPTEQTAKKVKPEESDIDQPIVLWEIYDLIEKKITTIAEEGEIPLMDAESLPKGIEDHPYAILRFTLRDDSPYPIPPVSQGIDAQKEYNLARSQLMVHRKRFNRKYEVLEAAIDPIEISKLESGEDGAIIKVKQQGSVQAIQDAPLDQMRYMEIGYLNQDLIELLGGTTDEAKGIAGAESATQAGILDKRLEVREGDAMSMVIDFTKEIAKKLDQLVQVHISQDEAVKVTGPQGEFWELVTPSDYEEVEGEFQYSVNVGATIPLLPQMERQSWMAFLQLLGNFPHLLTQQHLMKRVAEMHHIEDEAMLNELYQLGQQIMGGQVPMPGQSGSQPGVGETRPVSAMGGQGGGMQSLMQNVGQNR